MKVKKENSGIRELVKTLAVAGVLKLVEDEQMKKIINRTKITFFLYGLLTGLIIALMMAMKSPKLN